MSDPFRGRVAVITGGAGGIGFAMAEAFAARGAKIALADLDEAAMDARAKLLRERGAEVLCVRTDVTQRASVNALADRVFQHFGAAHLICNNAGIAIAGPLLQMTQDDWRLTMDIDFWGVVHGALAFAPRMIEQKQGGHILNTASMAGLVGMSWLGVYCAAKFAVVGFTESLRRELEAHEIGVSVLCPMIVETKINENSLRMRPSELRNPDGTDIAQTGGDAPPLVGGTIRPEELARRVVRAVERRDFYILTHSEQREILKRRAQRIDETFAPERWPLE
jgi:NAD(P)-dependent dehydrogenase (short-subunit alcohol dehydrogenase family)